MEKRQHPYKNPCTYDPLVKALAVGLAVCMAAGTVILYKAGRIGLERQELHKEKYHISQVYHNINK